MENKISERENETMHILHYEINIFSVSQQILMTWHCITLSWMKCGEKETKQRISKKKKKKRHKIQIGYQNCVCTLCKKKGNTHTNQFRKKAKQIETKAFFDSATVQLPTTDSKKVKTTTSKFSVQMKYEHLH